MFIGEIAALACAASGAATITLFTYLSNRMGVYVQTLYRLLFGVIFVAAVQYIMSGTLFEHYESSRQFYYILASGVIGFTIGDLFLFRSNTLLGPRLGVLIFIIYVPMATIMAVPLLGEEMGGMDIIGMIITLAGVAMVVMARSPSPLVMVLPKACHSCPPPSRRVNSGRNPVQLNALDPRFRGDDNSSDDSEGEKGSAFRSDFIPSRLPLGIFLGTMGALCNALGLVLSKMGMEGSANSTMNVLLVRIAAAAAASWIAGFFVGYSQKAIRERPSWRLTGLIVIGAILGPLLSVWLSLVAVRYAYTGVATTIMALAPIMVIPFAQITHREKITPQIILGTIIAIAGVAVLFLM